MIAAFSFDAAGAKEKAWQKENAASAGRRPATHSLFEKSEAKTLNALRVQALKKARPKIIVFATLGGL